MTSNTDTDYSGDVTLTGDAEPPVKIAHERTLENVYIKPDSIDGDLTIKNAEYIYTNQETGGSTNMGTPNTEISGDLDDGYVEDVEGGLIIDGAEDVFIAHNAVSGTIQSVGEEQQFTDEDDTTPPSLNAFDADITGWQQRETIESPTTGVIVSGWDNSVTITDVTEDIHVYVLGGNNTIDVEGQRATVTLHLTGSGNSVELSPYLDIAVGTDSGIENSVDQTSFPVDDLIETTKNEAYSDVFIGRKKVTYQGPARDKNTCPGCGAEADAVIERHQTDAFFVFGHPVYRFDSGGVSYQCEECSENAMPEVKLTEEERKNLFQ